MLRPHSSCRERLSHRKMRMTPPYTQIYLKHTSKFKLPTSSFARSRSPNAYGAVMMPAFPFASICNFLGKDIPKRKKSLKKEIN